MLYFILFSLVSTSLFAQEISGYVGLPGTQTRFDEGNDFVTIRQPDRDLMVRLSALTQAQRETIQQNDGSPRRVTLDIPPAAIIRTEPRPNAVRPDCSEMPMSYPDLAAIAKQPGINNQIDFLRAIPPGTLQTFTFNFNSKSAQGPGVSPEMPGIVRMSQDGKLVLRYTCDPSKPTYNKIEVLTYDDSTEKYKMASIDLGKPRDHRVEENPKLCLSCHNPGGEKSPVVDPRPNWQQYDQWTGFYGSEDDTFVYGNSRTGTGNPVTREEIRQQQANYLNFRQNQKDNPCYSSLPWPENPDPLYPYSNNGRNSDYTRRPGLKFTEVQCHLAGRRLARKFREKPEYNQIKYALAMSSLGCREFKPSQITQVVPEARANNFQRPRAQDIDDAAAPGTHFSAHYEVGRAMGFRNMDWTMNFNQNESASYNCGLSGGNNLAGMYGDITIGDVMQGELMKDVSSGIPALKGKISTTRGESESFGRNFACIDDLGGAPASNELSQNQVCSELAAAQNRLERDVILPSANRNLVREWQNRREADCNQNQVLDNQGQNLDDLISITAELEGGTDTPNVDRGREVARGACMECHNGDMGMYEFLESEEITREFMNNGPFIDRIKARISDPQRPMPPSGRRLSDREKADLEAYMRSFIN